MKASLTYLKFVFKVSATLGIIIFFSACSVNKFIPEGKILIRKAVLKNAPSEDAYELGTLIKQKPRRRGFGMSSPYLWAYMKLGEGKKTRFKENLQSFIGEKPVYLDTNLSKLSVIQMTDYLQNRGFFSASVNISQRFKKKQVKLTYEINTGKPYIIRSVDYFIADRMINRIVDNNLSGSLIKTGEPYNSDDLIYERDRLTNLLNNKGYFRFTKSYVNFDVDTALGNNGVGVSVFIRNLSDTSYHRIFRIRNVGIEPFYQFGDTSHKDTVLSGNYNLIGEYKFIKPQIFDHHIVLQPNSVYSLQNIRTSINQLSELQYFKFIDIDFDEDSSFFKSDTGVVDCTIRLTPMEKRSITTGFELNTTDESRVLSSTSTRYFGLAGDISLINRNAFKRVVQWSVTLGGAVDLRKDTSVKSSVSSNYQLDLKNSFYFPQALIMPYFLQKLNPQTSKTVFTLAYFLEKNIDFQRQTMSFNYIYQFNFKYIRHFFSPFEISLINTQIEDYFRAKLDSINDPLLSSAFDPHLITSTRWALTFSDKDLNPGSYWRIRAVVPETAGNIPWLFIKITSPSASEPYKIGGINFFQYLNLELDATHYNVFNRWQSLVTRINLGIAFPYGNSKVLPFEKRFYLGGANSLRAWPLRGIGPGSYNAADATRFDRTGELKFETNIEYRFDMFAVVEGAVFVDAGNIWNFKHGAISTIGVLDSFNQFFEELAVNTGAGFRFDFTYFIIRFDIGVPIRDPLLPVDRRWEDYKLRKGFLRGNIGIGYPF